MTTVADSSECFIEGFVLAERVHDLVHAVTVAAVGDGASPFNAFTYVEHGYGSPTPTGAAASAPHVADMWYRDYGTNDASCEVRFQGGREHTNLPAAVRKHVLVNVTGDAVAFLKGLGFTATGSFKMHGYEAVLRGGITVMLYRVDNVSGGKVAPVSVTQVAEYANERPIHAPITTTATEFCIDGLDDEAAADADADADADVDMGDKGGSSSATSAAKKLLVVPTVPWLVRLSLVVPGARVAEAAAAVRQTFTLLSDFVVEVDAAILREVEVLETEPASKRVPGSGAGGGAGAAEHQDEVLRQARERMEQQQQQ